jgi:hypothetical protein
VLGENDPDHERAEPEMNDRKVPSASSWFVRRPMTSFGSARCHVVTKGGPPDWIKVIGYPQRDSNPCFRRERAIRVCPVPRWTSEKTC